MTPTLIILTRLPVAGHTKTRLIGALGPQGAADLHRDLAGAAVATARRAATSLGIGLEVHHTGEAADVRCWLGDDLHYRPQVAGDLGQRMAGALATAGLPALLMGSDCPGLSVATLQHAVRALADHEVVLGPAADGGYYLIGLARLHRELFDGLPWGTDQVLAQTLAVSRRLGLQTELLEVLPDIDRPADLRHLPSSLQRHHRERP